MIENVQYSSTNAAVTSKIQNFRNGTYPPVYEGDMTYITVLAKPDADFDYVKNMLNTMSADIFSMLSQTLVRGIMSHKETESLRVFDLDRNEYKFRATAMMDIVLRRNYADCGACLCIFIFEPVTLVESTILLRNRHGQEV
jgi:hypothetical protein